jgi:hypothetical protein
MFIPSMADCSLTLGVFVLKNHSIHDEVMYHESIPLGSVWFGVNEG